jgi:hypothetical protein
MMPSDGLRRKRTIVRELSVDLIRGVVARSWRATEDGLILRTADVPEGVRLRCVCSRGHWIVREQYATDGVRLLVTCHSCGTRGAIQLESSPLPAE